MYVYENTIFYYMYMHLQWCMGGFKNVVGSWQWYMHMYLAIMPIALIHM